MSGPILPILGAGATQHQWAGVVELVWAESFFLSAISNTQSLRKGLLKEGGGDHPPSEPAGQPMVNSCVCGLR